MAELQLFGKILSLGDKQSIPTKNGGTYEKREVILDCTRYSYTTGEPIENFPVLEFGGKSVPALDNFQVGSEVIVSFRVNGVRYTDKTTNELRYFTKLEGYKCEPWVRGQQPQGASAPAPQGGQAPAPAPQPTAPQDQPFPPAVDEDGNPVEKGDDLPF